MFFGGAADGGYAPRFLSIFLVLSFSVSTASLSPPPPSGYPQGATQTRAVETVEKVSFQKLFLKSGTETLKSVWFLVFRTTFWQFLSLLWEIFMNIFRTRGFSTASLGGY
jgi:hypothetical protein